MKTPAYLCFRGPLIALLLLTAAVCAVWNELSVYKLEGNKNTNISTKLKNKNISSKTSLLKRKGNLTSVVSTAMGSVNSSIISVSVRRKTSLKNTALISLWLHYI